MLKGPILVAGRSGQLARCLVDSATQRGAHVVAVGRPELNLEDVGSIERGTRAVEPGAIVNVAAYTAVDRAELEPERAFAVNRDGAEHLAVEAQKRSIPLIHLSTGYVFDGRKLSSYTEEDAPAPLNIYGQSKLEGEIAVLKAYPSSIVLRASWVYSTYGNNFVKSMLRLAKTHDSIRVVDDQTGSPTSANELANAILDILQRVGADGFGSQGGLYHVTAQGETTWHGFASFIFDNWAKRGGSQVPNLIAINTAEYSTSACRPANSRLDCAKVKRQFGIRLPSWQRSVEACLDRLWAEAGQQTC